jgi:hypothetical protein
MIDACAYWGRTSSGGRLLRTSAAAANPAMTEGEASMASEYHRGEMDIEEQVSTFHAFNLMTKWGSLALAVSLLMTTLWFCTKAGFLGGLITGVVVLAVGVLVLREKKKPAH